ncbi:hypothetical protein L1049_015057 [Liquidambar formosana]|uniref:Uncharacterized protein n=1 Tax=Liquidambar formosana TaxID=63359 RepID=A0AAP0X1M3_LIQFO
MLCKLVVAGGQYDSGTPDQDEDPHGERPNLEEQADGDNDQPVEENVGEDFTKLTGRQKKLFELRLKMNEARKANQTAMVAEKKRMEGPQETRGISKQKWIEERKKKIGKLLDANGLDMTKAYMLDTQEMAEVKYKKWEKGSCSVWLGWYVFYLFFSLICFYIIMLLYFGLVFYFLVYVCVFLDLHMFPFVGAHMYVCM